MITILAVVVPRRFEVIGLGIVIFFVIAIPIDVIASWPQSPRAKAELQLAQGWKLAFDVDQYDRAKAVLSAIFATVLPLNRQPLLASALAWCDVHLGDLDHAVSLAEGAVEHARKDSDQNMTDCLAVLRATCVVAGKALARERLAASAVAAPYR